MTYCNSDTAKLTSQSSRNVIPGLATLALFTLDDFIKGGRKHVSLRHLFTCLSHVGVRKMMWCRQCFRAVRTWRDVCTQAGNLGTGFNESTVVLGIESSFDDTAVGIVQGNGKILGEAVHSQLSAHKT